MKFKRVQQVRLHEQIVARFNEMADAGLLLSGDRLPPERELLTQLGVSRPVLREALTVMEAQGMISTTQGGGRIFRGRTIGDIGALVEALKESALFEILDAREAIEGKIAELAAALATADEIEELRARLGELQPEQYSYEWNYGFHLAIAELARNDVLHNFVQMLLQVRREVDSQDYLTREQLARTFEDHAAIVEAIAAREPNIARRVMEGHIARTRNEFQQRQAERAKERRGDPQTV
jgi:GntR family transcriptional regulator, transcriptional repressor for pyruvate dehydrogenase complex